MKSNSKTMTLLAAAITLAACEGPSKTGVKASGQREKCKVNSTDGKIGFILSSRNDCAANGHSCAGEGVKGSPNEWIFVPAGKCADINKHVQAGKFNKVDSKIREKLDLSLAKKHVK